MQASVQQADPLSGGEAISGGEEWLTGHFACCACCADPARLPGASNFVMAANLAANGAVLVDFAPGTATVEDVADYLNTGYWSWATDGDWSDGAIWDVSDDRELTFDVSMLSDAAADLARLAFETWATVVDLTFVEQAGNADITFSDAEEGAFSFFDAVQITPEGTPHKVVSAYVNVGRSWLVTHGDTPDSFSFQTFLHEIGHAIGLGHAGPYNTVIDFSRDAIFSIDSWQVSVMSYFDQADAGVGTRSELRTPMLADLVALDGLYGLAANETGDTVYGFNATAGLAVFDAAVSGPRAAYTIHDTGGTDTLDYSGFAENQVIDLRPTGISNVGSGRGNVILGSETLVERVITGAGDDVIHATASTLFIDAGAGADRVDFNRAGAPLTLDLQGGTGALVLVGVETLVGTTADDVILGDDAAITFIGGAGNDRIDGRGGADTAAYSDAPAGVVVDLAAGTAADGHGGTDTLAGIRHLIGSAQADMLRGDDQGNRMAGGDGDDLLLGGAGDDVLLSGLDLTLGFAGDEDVLQGGTGDDTLHVSGGLDEAWGGAGHDLLVATALDAGDRFALYGGEGDDQLTGSDNDDQLNGGQGRDRIDGGDGADTVLAGGGADAVAGERGNDALNGSGGDDHLDGGAGHDRLQGGGGDDTLIGAAGRDEAYGGAGNDTLDGGDDDDALRGAAGDDTGLGGDGNDLLVGAVGRDTLSGSDGDDTVIGGRDGDTLRGGSGTDTLLGQGGEDVIVGQAGGDLVNGAAGDDQLDGGPGNDTLNGGSGEDRLIGGSGDDNLAGQSGLDTFIFAASDTGQDRVSDFTAGETVLLLDFGYATASAAEADLVQSGNDTVFNRGDVSVIFENAALDDVAAAISIGNAAQSSADVLVSPDIASGDPELLEWDGLL